MKGRTISHYRIVEKLGEGGMGVVYKAHDTQLDRFVALKALSSKEAADPVRRRRFIQEAKAASALNHPNIVTVYDIATDDGVDYIVMEFVAGKTLELLIPKRGMRLNVALKYAIQIAGALAAAHSVGIVHRDLKPRNVMVDGDGRVRLLDFGLAKLTRTAESSDEMPTEPLAWAKTEEGIVVGTASYMSPEQALGQKVDHRSDVFSFGSLLYEMITGERPFQGNSQIAALADVINKAEKPVHEATDAAPSELGRIIHRCLEKDQGQRWQSMADVRMSLEDLEKDLEAGRLAPDASEQRRTKSPWLWLAAAAAVVAAAILGARFGDGTDAPEAPRYELRRLTLDAGLTFQPVISPDGALVAYASDRAGNGDLDLWVQHVEGGGQPIRLTTHGTDDFEPAFSPNGSQIVFRSDRDGGGIFMIPALGGSLRMITKSGHQPSFSPDGRYVAFRGGERAVGTEIFTTDLQTGEVTPVRIELGESAPAYWYCYHPIWSPDGEHLLFATGTADSVEEWWVVPAGGGVAENLKVVEALGREGLLQAVPHAWSPDNRVVFSATDVTSGRESLWQFDLSPNGFQLDGPASRLTFGTGSETQASVAGTGRLVFASREQSTDLWRVPIAPGLAEVTGQLERMTQGPAAEGWPTADTAGGILAYVVNSSGKTEFTSARNRILIENLETRAKAPLGVSAENHQAPVLSPDGALLLFRVREEGRDAIYRVPTSGGIPEKVCDDCGNPTDVSSDGRTALRDGFSGPSGIGILDLGSGTVKGLLQPTKTDLYSGQFSPDDRWIAFHARASQGQARQVFVAPFRRGAEIPPAEWLAITSGSSNDAAPQWSPAGDALYYLSNRDGFRCLWVQPLNPATKRPVGEASAVAHFHEPGLSATNIGNPGIVRPIVTRDSIILTLAETTGNIWMMEPRPPR